MGAQPGLSEKYYKKIVYKQTRKFVSASVTVLKKRSFEKFRKMATINTVDKMNLSQLQNELEKRQQSTEGQKAMLKFRLMTLVMEEEAGKCGRRQDDPAYAEKTEKVDELDSSLEDDSNEKTKFQSFHSTMKQPESVCENKVSSRFISFRDAEDSVDKFSGDGSISVKTWLSQLEEINYVFKFSEEEMLVYAKKLLIGAAKQFIKLKRNVYTWSDFKKEMIKEFYVEVSSRSIHEKLRNRRLGLKEAWREYFYEMVSLGDQINLDNESLIGYIVDGVYNSQEKIILYGSTSIEILKAKFCDYDRAMKLKISKNFQPEKQKDRTIHIDKPIKCYLCGEGGHRAKECPHSKKGPKCFNCSEFGHISNDCIKKKKSSQVNQVVSGDMMKSVIVDNVSAEALVDTGADPNLVRSDLFQQWTKSEVLQTERCFTGLGLSSVKSRGIVKKEINIDGEIFQCKFYIVPMKSMSTKLILGREFLAQCDYAITSECISIRPKQPTSSKKEEFGNNIFQIEPIEDDPDVIPKYREQLRELIKTYKPEITNTNCVKTEITVTETQPIYIKARRLAPLEKRVVQEQVDEWLEQGIVIPSNSPYSSPVVIVKKKSGGYRLCIDFRRLNKIVQRDRFPMPRIDDQLDKLVNANVFSTLDFKNGFFHVPMEVNSRKYTAFSTAEGHYEFTRTPFGLCISPHSFCRFIYEIFKDLIARGVVIIYVDDIIIPSQTASEGYDRLKEVLKVASSFGLQINWEKCKFLKECVEYLGHIICDSKIYPSKEKVIAVKKFPRPDSVKQLQSFLGLVGYFRKFVNGFAKLAQPLTALLKKDVQFVFGEEQMLAFELLKDALTCEPVLQIYDPEAATTELHTDASKQGLAGILLQRRENQQHLHPVFFWSRATSNAEKNYHSYELEALAVVSAVKKFRAYLLGITFTIRTDCSAFSKTVNKADVPDRVKRYTIELEEFDYKLEFRAGEQMKHVDALSRNTVMVVSDIISLLIKDAQNQDDHVKAIKTILEKEAYENYSIENDVLFKYVGDRKLLVVPTKMYQDVISRAHQQGHFGVKKTEELIKKEFFIPKLIEKIEYCIRCCIPCILMKRKYGKAEGKLYPIPKEDEPLDTFHADHLTALATTPKGYKYILVVVDAFSKFTWLFPVKTTNTKEVLEKLQIIATTFGYPRRIITDRGTAFTSAEFQSFCEENGIEYVLTTTGVPRGNGQVERVNEVVIPVLSKLAIDQPQKWFQFVPAVQRCINSTFHTSIGLTPFEAMTGVKMRNKGEENILKCLRNELVLKFNDHRAENRQKIRDEITKAQEEQKRHYDKNRKEARLYIVGELVAIKRTQFGSQLKLRNRFLGPYKVVRVLGNDRYEVRKIGESEGPHHTLTSADNMKLWCFGSSEADENRMAV